MRELVSATQSNGSGISISAACDTLCLSRATFYRGRSTGLTSQADPVVAEAVVQTCRVSGRALSVSEQERVISELHSDRFMDLAPPQVYAKLIDEGTYLCSISTMYRLLRKLGEIVERRRLRTHPPATRPELMATGPNQVWSWDITKLKGPRKWSYYYLYVILDVFTRYVVGWCIAERENAQIAEALIQETLLRENIPPGTLTIHADRGSAMTSTTVAELLIDLGVTKSHSRPHTSNDNPFSEAHFKTLKYRPEMPSRFESVEQARALFRDLIHWYNHEHRHSGLAMLTPATVHAGRGEKVISARAKILDAAFAAHPARFVNQPPRPEPLPKEVWINPPAKPVEPSRDGSGDAHAAAA